MTDWTQAVCRDQDAETWFPDQGGPVLAAKALCHTCPLLHPCQAVGLDESWLRGVWGALGEGDRRDVRQGRATPGEIVARDVALLAQRDEVSRQRQRRRREPQRWQRTSRRGDRKRCCGCGEWLHESEFYSDRTRWDGVGVRCRPCARAHRARRPRQTTGGAA